MTNIAPKVKQGADVESARMSGQLSPLGRLHREMDRLFDQFGDTQPWFRRMWEPRLWDYETPAMDVAEKPDGYEITAELPGVEAKDIEVTAEDGILTVRAERAEEKEEKDKRYYLSERHYGSFERSLSLPAGIDVKKIEADYKAGVLRIHLPKTPEAKGKQRKIAVKTH